MAYKSRGDLQIILSFDWRAVASPSYLTLVAPEYKGII
jgi:hypothetical protein